MASRVAKAVLISAAPPLMLRRRPTRRASEGVFDDLQAQLAANRSSSIVRSRLVRSGFNRAGAKLSGPPFRTGGVRHDGRRQGALRRTLLSRMILHRCRRNC